MEGDARQQVQAAAAAAAQHWSQVGIAVAPKQEQAARDKAMDQEGWTRRGRRTRRQELDEDGGKQAEDSRRKRACSGKP